MSAWRDHNLKCLTNCIVGLGQPEDADLDVNLAFLADLRDQAAELTAVINEVERTCAQQMPRRTHATATLAAEKHRSYADTWDHRRAAWAVIEPALIDEGSGEVIDDKVGWRILDRLLSFAAISYFRTTAMDAAGLDPGEYRTRELRRTIVKITRSTEDGAP